MTHTICSAAVLQLGN